MRKIFKKFCFSIVIACICFVFSMLLQSYYNVEFTKRVQIAIAMLCAIPPFLISIGLSYMYVGLKEYCPKLYFLFTILAVIVMYFYIYLLSSVNNSNVSNRCSICFGVSLLFTMICGVCIQIYGIFSYIVNKKKEQ